MSKNILKETIIRHTKMGHLVATFGSIKTEADPTGYITKSIEGLKCGAFSKLKKSYINENDKCLAILTGQPSNNTIIDFDTKTGYNKFLDLFPEAKEFYTVLTNKGAHLYSLYTDKLKSKIKAFYSFEGDILNGNGIVICEPTQYKLPNGAIAKYELINKDAEIIDMPDAMLNYFLEEVKLNEEARQKSNLQDRENRIKNAVPNVILTLNTVNNSIVCETKETTIINYTELELITLMDNLYTSRFHDWKSWYYLSILCKTFKLENKYEIWVELSKKSDNFNETKNELFWDSLDAEKKDITPKNLVQMAREDCPELFNKLLYNKFKELPIQVPFLKDRPRKYREFKRRFLIDLEKGLLDDENIVAVETQKFIKSEVLKALTIKAPMGSGKTFTLMAILKQMGVKRILFLSHRQSFTRSLIGSYKEFNIKNYMDGSFNADVLVIQPESLLKLQEVQGYKINSNGKSVPKIPKYDMIIIDESESILNQFNSTTMRPKEARETFDYLCDIIDNSGKVICLDGDISNRTYTFIETFGKCKHLIDVEDPEQKIYTITNNTEEYYAKIEDDIQNNKKIVLVSMSSDLINSLNLEYSQKYPDLKIQIITADTDDKIKLKLEDVSKYFSEADLLMYSPTIEAGVDYNIEHFDKMYVILCESTSQRSLSQMMGRIRKVKSNEVLMLAHELKFNETRNFFLVKDVINNYEYINKKSLIKKTVVIDGERCQETVLTLFDTIYCYNKVEELNKKRYYFLQYLQHFLENKGHKVIIDFKEGMKKKSSGGFRKNEIINAIPITTIEFLNIKDLRIKSEEQKYSIQNYMVKNIYGIDALDENFMNNHFRQEGQLFNLQALIDIANYPVYADDNRNIEGLMKLNYVQKLINDLGFKHVFDDAIIAKEEFDNNIMKCIETNPYFTDPKITSILFNSIKINKTKTDGNNKKVLGYMNSVFEGYGIKLSKVQKRVKGIKNLANFYKLEIVNDLPEFIQYRINRKKEFYNKDGIFKVDANTFKYSHLIVPKDNKAFDYEVDDFIDDIKDIELSDEIQCKMKPYYDAIKASKTITTDIIPEQYKKDDIVEEYVNTTLIGFWNLVMQYNDKSGVIYNKKLVATELRKIYDDITLLSLDEQKDEFRKYYAKYAII